MVIFIVAHDRNMGIGFKGRVPWPRMHADRERLHQLTAGKVLVMGRKSYDEFKHVQHVFSPKEVLVISSSESDDVPTVSLDEVRDLAKSEDIWVLGGQEIFEELLPDTSKIYLTQIDGTFEADTFFPELNMKEWKFTESQTYPKDASNPYPYTFQILEKL